MAPQSLALFRLAGDKSTPLILGIGLVEITSQNPGIAFRLPWIWCFAQELNAFLPTLLSPLLRASAQKRCELSEKPLRICKIGDTSEDPR
jgi:hypothetical protein